MNFAVYSKDGCPFCTQIVEVLNLAKMKFVVYKLDQHFDRNAFYEEFGNGSTFPQVVCNGQKLGGCQDTVKYLKEHNMI
tara:strand:- start:442 stop:678 length:237 start_codon:yes stop_codon:yes gene_type:complete